MYAIIETGGKQYRVEVGTELQVDLIDAEPGQAITFDRVLLVGDGDATAVGQPVVADAAVEAEVVRRDRGEKLIVFKYRPKARTRTKKGHRQDHIVLRITDVKLKDRSAAQETRKAEEDARTERQRLEEAAARQAAADAELAAKLAKRKAEATSEAKPARGSKAGTSGRGRSAPDTVAPDPDSAADRKQARDAAAERTQSRDAATDTATDDTAPAASATDAAGAPDSAQTTETTSDEPAPKRGRDKKDG